MLDYCVFKQLSPEVTSGFLFFMATGIEDIKFMRRAIILSGKGSGSASPNPLVGAVIVRDGRIISEGYHANFGGPHAEINAIHNANGDISDCTLYVTLEPCAHYGKTPPCTDEIIKKGIKRVVIGITDPNPLVAGKGIKKLAENGIEITTGIEAEKIRKLNESYVKFITTGIPFVTLKTAISFDGKIELPGTPGFIISNARSHRFVHRLRKQNMAILVGVSTVLSDDPLLTVRPLSENMKQPLRVILDSEGRTPLNSKVIRSTGPGKTLIYTTTLASGSFKRDMTGTGHEIQVAPMENKRVDLNFVMQDLGKRGISSVLVEGGSTLNASMIRNNIADKIILFMNSRIIGGTGTKTLVGGDPYKAANSLPGLRISGIKRLDEDIVIEAYFTKLN